MQDEGEVRAVKAAILRRRRVPCICPRQHEADPPRGESQGFSDSRGISVERMKCSACPRTWTRVNG